MATEKILAERGKTHGDFTINATIVQELKQTCRGRASCSDYARWAAMLPEHKEAIENICQKLGRILVGDPHHRDSWEDIAGYATLGARACQEKK
jgi:putative component of membrane protein insertase Oxa1/YidC/SpoIIIJ protein YidD